MPAVIPSSSYAVYRINQDPLRLEPVAERGGIELFIDRYKSRGYRVDPLLERSLVTLGPVHDAMLFSEDEWQAHPLRHELGAPRLMPMLVAPLLVEGEAIGLLYFSRRPHEPHFTKADVRNAQVISQVMAAAIGNSRLHREAREQADLGRGALELIGSGVVITDLHGRVRYTNQGGQRLLDGGSGAGIAEALKENLEKVDGAPRRDAVVITSFANNETSVIIRSQRLRDDESRVATFLYTQSAKAEGSRFSPLLGLLSEREVEVLEMIARGAKTVEIARALYVSTDTVQYYLRRMFAVMDAGSRAELLAKAHAAAGVSPG